MPPEAPAAMLVANRVRVCSAAARREGVMVGLRKREAQARCPALVLVDADPGRDARAFEPVVVAVEDLAPAVEVVRPGLLALAARGPSRAWGGEEAMAVHLAEVTTKAIEITTGVRQQSRVGIAEGRFAATLAARQGVPVRIVPVGGTPAFLAYLPVSALATEDPDLDDLVFLLGQLGLRTLGELVTLPAVAVLDRFGPLGAAAHRLAGGEERHRLAPRTPPPDLAVQVELDPPADRVDAVAFAGRALADDLVERLGRLGLIVTLVAISAQTEHGEDLVRRWRHHDGFTAPALTDRARWQVEGWLSGSLRASERPTAGIILLRLSPLEVVSADGHQPALWGGPSEADLRAGRALTRLQGLLGPDAVLVGEQGGGRRPAAWVVPISWDGSRQSEPGRARSGEAPPWPGRIPSPAPATVLAEPVGVEVVGADGSPVGVSARGVSTAAPAAIRIESGRWHQVTGWAGPWPADERWWDAAAHSRGARLQVTTAGEAYLLILESGRWRLEAVYD